MKNRALELIDTKQYDRALLIGYDESHDVCNENEA